MTIDHVGAILYPDFTVLRMIGRLSFPLFAYLLILGMETTRNIRNYFIRLFLFSFISQVPFSLALGYESFEYLNVFFTLSLGLLFIYFFKKNSPIALVPVLVSFILPIDYGIYGIAVIGCMQILKDKIRFGSTGLVLLNSLFLVPWNIQFLSVFAIPLILFHKNYSLTMQSEVNEKVAYPSWRKYFFYVYYPFHLSLLFLIKTNFFFSLSM